MMTDREWLSRVKPRDAIGVLTQRAQRIASIVDALQKEDRLPHTIGMFGTWGSGKTATAAYLADELEARGYLTVYFNAYKYSSYMEVVPALIYRLIEALPISKTAAASERLIRLMATLSSKYSDRFGGWVESKVGLNPVELVKDLAAAKDILTAPDDKRQELLEAYYTRVDRAQDTLAEVFEQAGLDAPVVVLIDELDRCDPGEAFDAMKQLRILFNMRGLRIVFVLVANPQPIGLAIRHQFGLDASEDEYEAGRILEKFVDTYIDLMEPSSLGNFVTAIWQRVLPDKMLRSAFIIGLDARTKRKPGHTFESDGLANGTALERMTVSNSLYSNLRTLEKSLTLCAHQPDAGVNLWTSWHLNLLRQSDPALRRDVARVTHWLKDITASATLRVIQVLAEQGQITGDGRIREEIWLDAYSPHTPYAVFYNAFWDATKETIRSLWHTVGREEAEVLARMKASVPAMNFVITMCMPSYGHLDAVRVNTSGLRDLRGALGGGADNAMANFGWLLGEF